MRPTRLAVGATVALAVAILPSGAMAHAELASSSPAADETLAAAPETVSLVFDGELLPDGTGFTVSNADGGVVGEGELDLTVADRNEIQGDVRVRQPGTYTVAWTAVSADGHEQGGDFAFTVAAPPNTAVAPAPGMGLAQLGSIALLVALGIGMWRARMAMS
ncbi:MAG: copper resistance protein [Chloroflexota bacterium]|nr:copper resistance protein [Chloroflexota bacterium]